MIQSLDIMDIKIPNDIQKLLCSKHSVQKGCWGVGIDISNILPNSFQNWCWTNNATKVKYGKVGITVLKHAINTDSFSPKSKQAKHYSNCQIIYKPGKKLNSRRPKSLAKMWLKAWLSTSSFIFLFIMWKRLFKLLTMKVNWTYNVVWI